MMRLMDQLDHDEPIDPRAQWAADVVLSDGGTVHVRPIRPDDADRLRELHEHLSPEAVYYRFFTPMPRLSDHMVERLVNVDYHDRMAIVAQLGDKLIAVSRYDLIDTDRAEVAFVVDDAHQGRGLGTIMLEHLIVIARANGIGRFEAQTLSDNQAMLRVFRGAGFEVKRRFDGGVVEIGFSITATEKSLELIDQRDQRAVARSIRRLLHPKSIAVIGASRDPGTVGHELVRHLLDAEFAGPVFPVNPNAGDIKGVYAFPSVLDIPIGVDLAVIAVPAAQVLEVVHDCATKGVAGLVVVSSGFADAGEAGLVLQREVVDLARRNGMRVIGPNSMGVVNTAPDVRLNATFARSAPGPAGSGSCRSRVPSASPCWARATTAGSASPRSSPPATRETSRATTCCSTGNSTTRPMWCCSTSRTSATRGASPASPAAWPAASRSSR